MPQVQRVGLRPRVVFAAAIDDRRARLRVPALELREGRIVRVRHRRAEVVARDRLSVVALEVEVHALAETALAEERRVHAHDLGALVVHGRGVEVVHLDVGIGAHRMGHGPGIFGELTLA